MSKWIDCWMDHARLMSNMSICPRNKVGAFIIDHNNNPISAGFNGPPRKSASRFCGRSGCDRERLKVQSGTRTEIGCHHAELNAIANAAARGIMLSGCSMFISVNPCLSCAKMIHHCGISRVIVPINDNYSKSGIKYLIQNNILIVYQDDYFYNFNSKPDEDLATDDDPDL